MTTLTFSVYRLDTGEFTGLCLGGPTEASCEPDLPAGCGLIEGEHGPQSARVVDGAVVPYSPAPDADPTPAARIAISRRNSELASCDWVVTRALEQGAAVPAPWAAYRQALRDITTQPGFPDDINWPAPPTE